LNTFKIERKLQSFGDETGTKISHQDAGGVKHEFFAGAV